MIVRWLPGPAPYLPVWQAMRDFTEARTPETPDEIWLAEHTPVYTLGQAGKAEHILNSGAIPVVQCDRGGQVTYHGPGQLMAYCLINLRRHHLFVKEYVELLEDVLIDLLGELGVTASRLPGAPGVYVPRPCHTSAIPAVGGGPRSNGGHGELAKIAALGIKVRNGCSYHGLALNIDMDLTPYSGINPCGYQGMPTTDLSSCGVSLTVQRAGDLLAARLTHAITDYGQRKGDTHERALEHPAY